ncbi:MAG: iron ABC transporter permease [Gammaproteobacteria bacterium]|nr:iron ABC transporter permease [Gammaproteobacteria bacterium]
MAIKSTALVALVSILISLPTLVVLGSFFVPDYALWSHLLDTVFTRYVANSAVVAIEVAIGTFVMGVSSAWFIVNYQFPGRNIFAWALMLPLAFPGYIFAFFVQPLSAYLPFVPAREWVSFCLIMTLYPYVYLSARAAFIDQSVCALEAARTLGCNRRQAFLQVALPMARPSIVAGVTVATMESLADYGTAQYFGLETISTGVLRTWFGHYNLTAAAQLAATLVGAVLLLSALERSLRSKAKFHHASHRYQQMHLSWLSPSGRFGLTALMSFPVVVGFGLPSLWLIHQATGAENFGLNSQFFELAINSLGLAIIVALGLVPLAVMIAISRRDKPSRWSAALAALSRLGYATPGTVLAIGVLVPLVYIDRSLAEAGYTPLGLTTGFGGLIFAYFSRFYSVAANTVEAGLERIHRSMNETARTLGASSWRLISKVYFPLMRGSALAAVLMVFVDIMKELPATLVLRPFDFNTLAVRAFELASDERLAAAAAPALCIVLTGLIPVLYLSRQITRSRAGHGR